MFSGEKERDLETEKSSEVRERREKGTEEREKEVVGRKDEG